MKRRIIPILIVLSMFAALLSFGGISASANGGSTLSSIEITIAEPVAGGTAEAGVFARETEFSASVGWSTTADGDEMADFNFETFEEGNTYYADFYFTASTGYSFSEDATVIINGTPYTAEWVSGSSFPEYVAVYDVPFSVPENTPIPTTYLYLGGVEVTDANASDILGNGKAQFDASTNTLTLNDLTINTGYDNGGQLVGIYTELSKLNIELVGINTIDHSLVSTERMLIGISGKNISISGGILNATTDFGIMATNGVTIEGSNINVINCGSEQGAYGIQSNVGVKISDSTLSFDLSSVADSVAVVAIAAFEAVDIERSTVNIDISGSGEMQVGIMAMQKLDIKTSAVTIEGMGTNVFGAYSYGNVEIDDTNYTAELSLTDLEGMCVGIASEGGTLTISGGKVEVSATGPNGSLAVFGLYISGGLGASIEDSAELKLQASTSALLSAPDLTNYGTTTTVTASTSLNGSSPVEYDGNAISTYKFLYIRYVEPHAHNYGSTWMSNATEHWKECECGEKSELAAHIDDNGDNKCDICGADVPVPPPAHTHDHGTIWKADANEHWNECACGDKANVAPHADTDNNGKCDICEYQMTNGGGNTETPDNPNNTPDDPTDDKDGLGAGAIIGIVIGSVAVVGIGGFALLWFVIKKKTWAEFLAIFKKK